jgi:hypothetical protein
MPLTAELAGYAELRSSWAMGADGTPWQFVERVRPRLDIWPTDRVKVQVVPELALAQGRDLPHEAATALMASPAGALLDAAGCAYARPPRYDAVSDYLTVERLTVDVNLPAVDLTIGRQAVSWGSSLAFRPTDLYAEVLLTEPWRERRGVNAVRATVPAGPHTVTAMLALDDDLSPVFDVHPSVPGSGALKATFNVAGMDLSAVGYAAHAVGAETTTGREPGVWDGFAGADLRGTLGVGWWVEGGWHARDGAPEVVVGLDYSLPVLRTLYVAVEGRWDGTGESPEAYDLASRLGSGSNASAPAALGLDCAFLATSPAPARSARTRTTLGRAYADVIVRLGVTESTSVNAIALTNLEDGSASALPTLAVNVGDRLSANLGAQVPFGTHGELNPDADLLTFAVGPERVDLSPLLPRVTLQGWVRTAF